MIHLSTLSDINYLTFGLTLYESLKKYNDEFILHYLALDNESHRILSDIKERKLWVYGIEDIRNKEYEKLKSNNLSNPTRISPYHYSMCSFFCHYLLDVVKLPHILYIDSDICFYDDPKDIIDCCNNYSIGFVTHKHIPLDIKSSVGFFNVGTIYFKNDNIGKECLKWWKEIGVYPNNSWSKRFGSCGDQKYLELFWLEIGPLHIKIIDEDIGHTAPWNITRSEIKNGLVKWNSEFVLMEPSITQKLYFNHFSHFSITDNSYKLDWDGEWGRFLDNPGAPELYEKYYNDCLETKGKYGL